MSKYISFPLDNTYYTAEAEQLYNSNRTNGVFSRDNEFVTTFKSAMTVTVSKGRAWLHTGDMKGFVFGSFEPVDLTLDIGDSVLNRIDRILIRYDIIANTTSLKVLKGTPASNPVPPAIVRNDTTYYDLCIAEVRVNAGTIILNQGMISDKRLDETVCGVVKDGIESIPTQALQNQWQSWFNNITTKGENDWNNWYSLNTQLFGSQFTNWFNSQTGTWTNQFNNWFQNLKNQLDSNQAANLQNQIDKTNSQLSDITKSNKKKVICFYTDPNVSVADAKLTFQKIKNIGAEYVLLSVSINNNLSTNIPSKWVDDAYTIELINFAKSINLKVALKCHNVPTDGDGTNNYKPQNATTWFANYKTLVLQQSKIASDNQIEYFFISNEMKSMTIEEFKSFWVDIIDSVKSRYLELKIGSSVNMPEALTYSLWNELDFYGFNLYPNLSRNGLNSTDNELRSSFYYDLEGYEVIPFLMEKSMDNKEIWVTETGCQPRLNALEHPSSWDTSSPYNEEIQRIYYEYALSMFSNMQGLSAISIWVANEIDGFTFFNRSSEQVVKKYFGGEI